MASLGAIRNLSIAVSEEDDSLSAVTSSLIKGHAHSLITKIFSDSLQSFLSLSSSPSPSPSHSSSSSSSGVSEEMVLALLMENALAVLLFLVEQSEDVTEYLSSEEKG